LFTDGKTSILEKSWPNEKRRADAARCRAVQRCKENKIKLA
jgi:hypothetical protein